MSIRFKPQMFLSVRHRLSLLLILTAFCLGGCGIGSNQRLDIETEPEGAFVYVNGKFIGNSPIDVKLNRQVPHRVELRKPGFVTQEQMVYPARPEGGEPKVVFGPLRESGFYRDLKPNPVSVQLVYEGLRGMEGTLSDAEAEALVRKIQRERESGELSDGEAAIALSQVQERMDQ